MVAARPPLQRMADPRPVRRPGRWRDPRRGRIGLVRAGRLPERGPRVDLDPFIGRADLRRRRPEDPDDLERDRRARLDLGRRRARGSLSQRRPRRDLVARLGSARSPEPSRLGARSGRPHLPHDRPAPGRCGADVGRHQRGRDVRDGRWRVDLGGTKSRGRRLLRAGSVPGDRPVRPQARDGRRRTRQPLSAEPLRRLPLGRRGSELGGREQGPACPSSGSSWARIRAMRPPAG